jgi:hypothetical protein
VTVPLLRAAVPVGGDDEASGHVTAEKRDARGVSAYRLCVGTVAPRLSMSACARSRRIANAWLTLVYKER